jgi:putative component of membrane protein insertase Oxa1/YidC/SpoIIIJ protein YidD
MKKIFDIIFIIFIVLGALWGTAFAGQDAKSDLRKVANVDKEKQDDTLLFPFRFYRDYISSVDGDRCQMYPTCSQYCSEAIQKHGALLGWIMCSDRLMRDGRDETELSDPVRVNGAKRSYDPVSNNDFWWQ